MCFGSCLQFAVRIPKQFARAVRNHWSIENTCHWSLDVTYREDAQRTRHRHLAENLAWLRRFTLSLIRQHSGKASLVMKRRMCGWNFDFMMEVLTGQQTECALALPGGRDHEYFRPRIKALHRSRFRLIG